jgi:FixJ family two-component response regulator
MSTAAGEWKAVLRGVARSLSLRRPRRQAARHLEPRILALVPEGPNRLVLQTISENGDWALTVTDSDSTCAHLGSFGEPPIIIYDRHLSPQHWGEILRPFARRSPRPYIILLSSNADPNLWDELQRVGASDILRSPVTRSELLGALTKAWQLWRIQQKVRPPVAAFKK